MKTKSLMLGTAAALSLAARALVPASAKTSGTDHAAAIEACSAINTLQPVEAIGAVDDGSGVGFSLVWLNDATGQLWMCDADTQGNVYSYSFVNDDLLEGAGPELISASSRRPTAAMRTILKSSPRRSAWPICQTVEPSCRAVGLTDDSGFVIFVKDEADALYLCNATAMVRAFEPIGDPLKFEGGEAVS
jgi:hypothetical protein